MPITKEHFRTNFRGNTVPKLLEELLDFQNVSPQRFAQGFELAVIPPSDVRDHVKEESREQFFLFGHDGNYSLYGLWKYREDISLEYAPVIYLNSEGEGSRVLADNLPTFFTLLAHDKEPIFGSYREKHRGWSSNRNPELLLWMAERYHLQPAEHPNDIVKYAEEHFPKLPLIY